MRSRWRRGLEQFLASMSGVPGETESATITMAGGIAQVKLRQVRYDSVGGRNGYIIWSRGIDMSPRLQGTAQAERTVAQYAVWEPGEMNVMSSWTSLTSVHMNGKSTIDGNDEENDEEEECGKAAPLPGVVVPQGGWSGKNAEVKGASPVIDDSKTQAELADEVDIDWEGLANGSAASPVVPSPVLR